jgi:YVTN family beta-propeller protein
VATVPVEASPRGVTVHPAGTFVYVAMAFVDKVAVIDTSSNTVTATIPVGDLPWALAAHPAGTFVYVANASDDTVSVIDTATNTVVASVVGVGRHPRGTSVHPAGTSVYVTSLFDGNVSVIDTATNTVVTQVPVGIRPIAFGQSMVPNRIFGCISIQGTPPANQPVSLHQPGEPTQTTTTFANGCYSFGVAVSGKQHSVVIQGVMP